MKINRLIGILAVLLHQEKVTAPVLAEKFEVSRRTINRDIEDLCKAGVPVVTTQGLNGGISIMEGYRTDRTLFTSSDMQAILAGLQSLDSVCGTNRYQQLMDKLSGGKRDVLLSNNHILIDLSSWYRTSLAPKIEQIQAAVSTRRKIRFYYYSPNNESLRTVEPYQLIFKWSSWYLWGYCCQKEDFRLFKLNRLADLEIIQDTYEKRQAEPPDLSPERVFPMKYEVKVLFHPSMKWRLIEEYGMDCFVRQEDGRLLFSSGFTDKTHLFSWILSFEDKAELLEPGELRQEMARTAFRMYQIYKNT